ncbi:hypothetical protein DIURU_000211 [Diutina rugosa]|uniref:Uncharacterized protein n=1 Tax=Diutina rugosa TaxID=5481 RepID=A0A642UZG3_DIURU|nr:uncharacterized protein DIURU_000211 [Diutina rugosa]KAA8908422.1 hypothetical protein DIURU_000211 [Diutina rugosa]
MDVSVNFHVASRQSQFRVPSELIRINFKHVQRLIEKQRLAVDAEVAKIKAADLSPPERLAALRKTIRGFETFQKKLRQALDKDRDYHARLEARRAHLCQLAQWAKPSPDGDMVLNLHNPNLIQWYRAEHMALIVDYLIKSYVPPSPSSTSGKRFKSDSENSGLKLLASIKDNYPGLDKLIDHDIFALFNRIFVSIVQEHDLDLVVAWFNDNKSFLKKNHSNLEFEINYCKFLSLIDQGEVKQAIVYSQTHLSVYSNRDHYGDGGQAMYEANSAKLKHIGGLLVYVSMKEEPSGEKVALMPRYRQYQQLLSNERWVSLSQCFMDNFNQLYGIPHHFPLYTYLSAGLVTLKTKSCYHNHTNTIFGNQANGSGHNTPAHDVWGMVDRKFRGPNHYYHALKKINHCPVCSPELFQLARGLPYAQLITNVFNNPFKLPNGNIYPFDKLLAPSDNHLDEKSILLRKNSIKDPLTHQVYNISDCVRVYPA